MAGKNAGVQALLREKYIPRAIYVHCYAHKLNLVICDVTKNIPYLSEFYSIVNKIFSFFHSSSVTNETFKRVQKELHLGKGYLCSIKLRNMCKLSFADGGDNPTTIKRWADTGWDSRWSSIRSIMENYAPLLGSFDELADESTQRSMGARGLSLALKNPLFIVTLFVLNLLLGKIKVLSDQLKGQYG